MISFHQFRLKEALSLTDPLAQSILKIIDKSQLHIALKFTIDNNKYKILIELKPQIIYKKRILNELNLITITLTANDSYRLTNEMGMQANTVYNMLLNAIKQANDHFGENNIDGYTFSGAQSEQDIMYDKLMKRFAPNLITWSRSIFLKPEAVQKLKDKNPDLIEDINNHIHQSTSEREMNIQQNKEYKSRVKSRQRSLRSQQP
jgi:hypothetical protein